MSDKGIPVPWRDFLKELDSLVSVQLDFHCIGGFVITAHYGAPRTTADMDVLSIVPRPDDELLSNAGKGATLHKKHGVYLDLVTVLEAYPENYDQRLTEIFPHQLEHIRLLAPEPCDLALMKLLRHSSRDREDVLYLAKRRLFDVAEMEARYHQEMRHYLANPEPADLTLNLWKEAIAEILATLG